MQQLEEVTTLTRTSIIMGWYEDIFPSVASFVKRRGGDVEMAKEIFQEAVVIYYEKIASSDFVPHVNDNAYLTGIAKKRWMIYRDKEIRNKGLELIDRPEEISRHPLHNKLMSHLRQAGKKCMDILQSVYYEKLSMKEVADRYGFKSERSATVQKYKCIEKVKDEVKRKSLCYEDFLD